MHDEVQGHRRVIIRGGVGSTLQVKLLWKAGKRLRYMMFQVKFLWKAGKRPRYMMFGGGVVMLRDCNSVVVAVRGF